MGSVLGRKSPSTIPIQNVFDYGARFHHCEIPILENGKLPKRGVLGERYGGWDGFDRFELVRKTEFFEKPVDTCGTHPVSVVQLDHDVPLFLVLGSTRYWRHLTVINRTNPSGQSLFVRAPIII